MSLRRQWGRCWGTCGWTTTWWCLCLRPTSGFWGEKKKETIVCFPFLLFVGSPHLLETTRPVLLLHPRGLLGAHVMADLLRQRGQRMPWYRDELLHMARELGHRLLPAFNTTSGLPYPKVLLDLTGSTWTQHTALCCSDFSVCIRMHDAWLFHLLL